MKVLMVCTGNLCRSPMAEALMRHKLAQRGCEDVEVRSSGTWAYDVNWATPEAVAVLDARGVDLNAHRSRVLDIDEMEEADIIVAMTSVHLRELKGLAPHLVDKVVLMKELPEIEIGSIFSLPAREDRLLSFLAAPRPPRRRSLDLDDPMGLPVAAYERALREIEAGVDRLVAVLCDRA